MATIDMNMTAFGLKNAGAAYQRLMDKVFNHLMGKYVEVYVDDMVVKSPSHQHIILRITTIQPQTQP